jgi:choice-of-anchor C domain-containing protein
MMKRSVFFMAAAAASLLTVPPARATINLVANGDFEKPVARNSSFDTVTVSEGHYIDAWQVVDGSVDLVRNYWQPQSGSQSLDTAGLVNGTIQQTIATVPGALYQLSFWMAGNPDGDPGIKTLRVSFGTQQQDFTFDKAGSTLSDMGWTQMIWDITADTSSTVLSFASLNAPSTPYGAALDTVSVTPVPEPTTLIAGALLLLPFGASTLRRVRGKRAV